MSQRPTEPDPSGDRRPARPSIDRYVVVAVVAVGIGASVWGARGVGVPRLIVAVLLAVVVVVILAANRTPGQRDSRSRLLWDVAGVLAATAIPLVTDQVALVWVAVVGVALAASTGLEQRVAAGIAVVPLAGAVIVQWRHDHDLSGVGLVALVAAAVFAMIWSRRMQTEANELAAARAVALAAERAQLVAARRQRELAGQIHDVLAHTLSGLVVVLQATSARARVERASSQLQENVDSALGLARDGMVGARDAVNTLRSEPGAQTDPGVVGRQSGSFDEWLLTTLDTARVEVSLVGRPASIGLPTADPAGHGFEALARSVVTEGLTNALRHAVGAPVLISLSSGRIEVLTVGDPARFVDRGLVSGGHGIAGLRERAADLGAQVQAGRRADGWVLTLVLPWAPPVGDGSSPGVTG